MPRRTHPPKRRGRWTFNAHDNSAQDLRPSSLDVVPTPARSPRREVTRTPTTLPPVTPKAPASPTPPRPSPRISRRTVRPVGALPVGILRAALAEHVADVQPGHLIYARSVEAIVLAHLRTTPPDNPPSVTALRKVVERERPRTAIPRNVSALVTAVIRAHLRDPEAA